MAATDRKPPDATQSTVLIDNNIIQHFLSKDLGKELAPVLDELAADNIILAVSQIVVYEALKAIVFDDKKFSKVNAFFEKYIVRYPMDEAVLIEAARIHEMYGYDPGSRNARASISTEDILIATTAIMKGAYILTCDANDFPAPFFKEVNRLFVPYNSGHRRKHIVIYLLEPDPTVIRAVRKSLEPPQT